MAASKFLRVMSVPASRAATRAASLQALATSAPVKPGVRAASFRESSTLSSVVLRGSRWTRKMEARPLMSGAGMKICLSKRPGRRRALSRTSMRLVAAMTITFASSVVNPSISTSSWFSVFSCSEWPPKLRPPSGTHSPSLLPI